MQETLNLILSELKNLRGDISRLETRFDRMETRLDQLETRLDQMDIRLDRIETRLDQMDTRLDRMEKDVFNTRLLVENEISKKIDIIGEGHDFLKQHLSDALKMEKKRERMELEIVNLQIEVKKIKEHLDIA